MKSLGGALLLALVVMGGCATPHNFDYANEPDPRKLEYVIGVADVLKITIWKNPDLSSEAKVRPDGTITLPLLGDLQAVGRTPGELKHEIMKRLSNYVKDENAVVTIAITETNSYRFTVSGNVEHPGVFTSKFFVTVLDAVALAGGLNKFAAAHDLVIIRNSSNGKVRRIPIDYMRVSTGMYPQENLAFFSGDTLYVP